MSWAHPLGTDNLGRDTLARLLSGGRVSIAVGVTAMLLSILIGTLVGVLAGFARLLDGPLMRLTDLFLALPLLPLLLVAVLLFREPLAAAFGPEGGTFILIVTLIGITSWMQTARIVRGEVLALKEREFVLAARSIGTSNMNLILRHILPNVMSPIMVSATLGIATAIITEIGAVLPRLRLPARLPDLGQASLRRRRPHAAVPGTGDLAGRHDLADRAERELHRRRAARRARPAHPGTLKRTGTVRAACRQVARPPRARRAEHWRENRPGSEDRPARCAHPAPHALLIRPLTPSDRTTFRSGVRPCTNPLACR